MWRGIRQPFLPGAAAPRRGRQRARPPAAGEGRLRWRAAGLGLLVAVLLAAGVGGYLAFGFPPAVAVYLAVLALTTEGFSGVQHLSGGEEIFTAVLSVLGVTVFLAVLGVAGSALIDGRIGLGRGWRMQRAIDRLSGHYIVCAYGRVGRTVARELEADGVPYLVIEPRADLEEELQGDGVRYLHANPSSEEVLRRAGIDRARGLVCAVDSDAENVFITLVARSLNPQIAIVARAGESASADRLFRAGANRVVSPYVTSGRRMALLALRPHVVDLLEISQRGDSRYRLEELLITEDSDLAGRALGEGCGAAIPLLLRRSDGSVLPSPDPATPLEVGDVIVVFGEQRALRPVETR